MTVRPAGTATATVIAMVTAMVTATGVVIAMVVTGMVDETGTVAIAMVGTATRVANGMVRETVHGMVRVVLPLPSRARLRKTLNPTRWWVFLV